MLKIQYKRQGCVLFTFRSEEDSQRAFQACKRAFSDGSEFYGYHLKQGAPYQPWWLADHYTLIFGTLEVPILTHGPEITRIRVSSYPPMFIGNALLDRDMGIIDRWLIDEFTLRSWSSQSFSAAA